MLATEKVSELLVLANRVHRETDYCVFIDFSGHVDGLRISVAESKKHYGVKIHSWNFYTDESYNYNYNYNNGTYEIVKETLEGILNK